MKSDSKSNDSAEVNEAAGDRRKNISGALVSVIIPAYNAEKFVLDAIHSVLQQDFQPLEILLIDDGSKDDTVALVKREAPQVRIIRQVNAGVAAARNTGLRHATGDYICFLDADDGWFPGKLAAQVNYLRLHPEVGVVYHKWHVWKPDENGVFNPPRRAENPVPGEIDPALSGWIYPRLLLDCVVHTSTVMMRREVARDIGFFDTALETGEDYDFWLRVSRKFQIHKLTGTHSFYRIASGSLTTGTPKSQNNEYNVIERALKQWGRSSPDGVSVPRAMINQRLSKLAFDFGYAHYHHGAVKLAHAAFLKSFLHQPSRVRAIAYLLATSIRRIFGPSRTG